jgi:hypothetical protein
MKNKVIQNMTKYNCFSRMPRVMALAVTGNIAGAGVYLLQLQLFK